jgi:hypothetical protein
MGAMNLQNQQWRLMFQDGETWCECEALDSYGTELHVFNEARLTPVVTTALRLECEPRSGCATGLLEWRV